MGTNLRQLFRLFFPVEGLMSTVASAGQWHGGVSIDANGVAVLPLVSVFSLAWIDGLPASLLLLGLLVICSSGLVDTNCLALKGARPSSLCFSKE